MAVAQALPPRAHTRSVQREVSTAPLWVVSIAGSLGADVSALFGEAAAGGRPRDEIPLPLWVDYIIVGSVSGRPLSELCFMVLRTELVHGRHIGHPDAAELGT